MNTPKSDKLIADVDNFFERIRERLVTGKREYGDKSFNKTPLELIREIQQELLDVCGWAAITYKQLDDLAARCHIVNETVMEILANRSSPKGEKTQE